MSGRFGIGRRMVATSLGLSDLVLAAFAVVTAGADPVTARPAVPPGYKISTATFDASFGRGGGRVPCARGKVVLGGGYVLNSVQGSDEFTVLSSAPISLAGTGWEVAWDNVGGSAIRATVDV
jgi:hypothetical protein